MGKVDRGASVLTQSIMVPEGIGDIEAEINEIYLDGKLNRAELIDDREKSFGIFIHSLILSNSDYISGTDIENINSGEIEGAISKFTVSKGFDKGLIESVAPKIADLTFENEKDMRVSTHLINGRLRFITRGMPDELLKRCTYVLFESKLVKLTRRIFREVNDAWKNMVNKGLEVFALGIKDFSNLPERLELDIIADNMALVALVGVARNN